MSDYKPHPLRRRRDSFVQKIPAGGVLVTRPTRWGIPLVIDMSRNGGGCEVRYRVRPGMRRVSDEEGGGV